MATKKRFDDERVRIATVVPTGTAPCTLDGYTFNRCEIIGPAVLFLGKGNTMGDCTYEAKDHSELLWIIPPERRSIIGAVALTNTIFLHCTFRHVGFATTEQDSFVFRFATP